MWNSEIARMMVKPDMRPIVSSGGGGGKGAGVVERNIQM